jgi:hypothetical protein
VTFESLDLDPAAVGTTFRCTQFPKNKSSKLGHIQTVLPSAVHLVAVSTHAHVALHALRTFLPASSAVLAVALVDELAFSLAAHGSEVAPISPLTAVLVRAALALALAAEAAAAALLPAFPAVVAVVLQVGAHSVAARLAPLAARLLGPALGLVHWWLVHWGLVHWRLVHWGLVALNFLALAALADAVLGAALATLAAVLVVAAQVHAPMVAATAVLEPPVALARRLARLGAPLRLRQHASGPDRSLISLHVGDICNLRLLRRRLVCIQ